MAVCLEVSGLLPRQVACSGAGLTVVTHRMIELRERAVVNSSVALRLTGGRELGAVVIVQCHWSMSHGQPFASRPPCIPRLCRRARAHSWAARCAPTCAAQQHAQVVPALPHAAAMICRFDVPARCSPYACLDALCEG